VHHILFGDDRCPRDGSADGDNPTGKGHGVDNRIAAGDHQAGKDQTSHCSTGSINTSEPTRQKCNDSFAGGAGRHHSGT
jgi:hypothetical protein